MVNRELLVSSGIITLEKLAGLYGEVYTRYVCEAAVNFVTKKWDDIEKRTLPLQTLEDLNEYVRGILPKHQEADNALVYAIATAEIKLQGIGGSAPRMALRNVVKEVTENNGLADLIGKGDDTTETLRKFHEVGLMVGLIDENSYNLNGNKTCSEVEITNCVYAPACIALITEGHMKNILGTPLCTLALGSAVAAEVGTKIPHDYEITKLDPPNCSARIKQI